MIISKTENITKSIGTLCLSTTWDGLKLSFKIGIYKLKCDYGNEYAQISFKKNKERIEATSMNSDVKKFAVHETKPSSANLSNLTLYSPCNKRQTNVCFTLILIFCVHALHYPATVKNRQVSIYASGIQKVLTKQKLYCVISSLLKLLLASGSRFITSVASEV